MGTRTHFGASSDAMISTGMRWVESISSMRGVDCDCSLRVCHAHADTAGVIKKIIAKKGLILFRRALMKLIIVNFLKLSIGSRLEEG